MIKRKILVLSGGTKGIGRATIEKFAEAGFDIITCARNRQDLRHLKVDIEARFGIVCHILPVNLAVKEQVLDFVNFIKSHTETIDVLINNAGVYMPDLVSKTEDGLLEKLIETNLYSAFYLTHETLSMLIKVQGHVFNICSVASIESYPNSGSYTISKFALMGFNKALREEMKPHGVRVTAILPGAVQTNSWGDFVPAKGEIMPAVDVAEAIFAAHSLSKAAVVEELLIRPQLNLNFE